MSEPTKIVVNSERDFVRRVIDLGNAIRPELKRIDGIYYELFEALVWANKNLGTINSPAAEVFVRDYMEKPDFSRKLYNRYRNVLADKGWLTRTGKNFQLMKTFDSGGDETLFTSEGLKKAITIPLMVIQH